MSRTRTFLIKESIEELICRETEYAGTAAAKRLRALVELRIGRTLNDTAGSIGVSLATLKRWMKIYREAGLSGLLGSGPIGCMLPDSELGRLEVMLMAGTFTDLADVLKWMDAIRGMDALSDHRSEGGEMCEGSGDGDVVGSAGPSEDMGPENRLRTADIVRFIESIPYTDDLKEWVAGIRAALRQLFPEIDRVSVAVNSACSLADPSPLQRDTVTQAGSDPSVQAGCAPAADSLHVDRFLANLRQANFPFDSYHPPHPLTLFIEETAYIGTLLLWRDRHAAPIARETLQALEYLRPLLQLVFFQYVALYQLARPTDREFHSALDDLSSSAGLSTQEQRVLALLLAGQTYNEIAEALGLSINTVRSHIKSIYAKADVHGQADLIARYFTPRVEAFPKADAKR